MHFFFSVAQVLLPDLEQKCEACMRYTYEIYIRTYVRTYEIYLEMKLSFYDSTILVTSIYIGVKQIERELAESKKETYTKVLIFLL